MNKEIKYSGYTAVPSDYDCADGELSTCLNLLPEDGALRPVLPPAPILQLAEGQRVEYIHKTAEFTHYIILDTAAHSLSWMDSTAIDPDTLLPADGALSQLHSFGSAEICSVEAVGNTLVVLAADGMHYMLWKPQATAEAAHYEYLGTHLPELPLSFGLQGEMKQSDEFSVYFDAVSTDAFYNDFSDNNKTRVTEPVLAKVNKFIAEESTQKGKFIYPFFVRYAYRLYDGSLTMHSMPVLMIASTDLAPQVAGVRQPYGGDGKYDVVYLRVMGVVHTLDYAVVKSTENATPVEDLLKWKDIVRSVDVFVSQPIYTYDQSGQCERFLKPDEYEPYCVCKHINQKADTAKYPLRYQRNSFYKLVAFTFSADSGFSLPFHWVLLPRRSEDKVKEDIRSASRFYMLQSIKIEDLKTERTAINVEEDYLQSLVAREVMTDDYDSHDKLIPKYSLAYNSRLNLANLEKDLYHDYNVGAQFCFTDGYVSYNDLDRPLIDDGTIGYNVYFHIRQEGREIVVAGDVFKLSKKAPTLFLFYPNVNAYKATIVKNTGIFEKYEVPLEKHDFLNGSFYFGGWENPSDTVSAMPVVSTEKERTVTIPNKIYTSEVNNPFVFPVTGINTVGTGTILGISSAAKALSQGQFGQFPLYAFTTDGVWALEVSASGSYSARQPITRDVCISARSITQIDSAVLFATARGIMLLSGSTAVCITDSLDAERAFDLTDLPHAAEIMQAAGITAQEADIQPFKEYIKGCGIVYDYTSQRITVYNPAYGYAYVYSLQSKAWGMMQCGIAASVNSYPEALAMDNAARLVDFARPKDGAVAGLVLTRPLKLGAPDTLKTIDTVLQRGYFRKGHVKCALYASRDLFSWKLVSSSQDHCLRGFQGTPFKYFRLALPFTLSKDESLQGCTVEFRPRLMNRPR